ncbi:glyoxylate/hydroxypyruvate reductase A [Geothrix rubra]|uniref:Glyoxylate/hydroxypyruvate reductase A n=1 Tax=Geothrix rubra TaxID=2927977 RepID=A0ABQ5Q5U3_9BACT|nr:D-2-hydroxyacid dehydrogenase [Geothrix rubra]GLH70077.1 glyoxylate/hydroxypyruvate reductase A [Geothrix rubra]
MRLAVLHHRPQEWASALQDAEPRLEIQSWHPRELETLDHGWLARAEGLFCWRLPAGLVARLPNLRWIQNSGAGVDHLLSDPELPPDLPISRADGAFGFWMARYVAGHLLAGAQRLQPCAEAQGAGRWEPSILPEDLTGEPALVVGFGRIGRQIGRALQALGLAVTGVVRTPRPDPEFPLVGLPDLRSRLGAARVLVLAAPLTPATRGLVDAPLLGHGNGQLTLFNVGRGELVDTDALLAALAQGTLGRAVLDVFPEEPLPAESPLWRHPGVTVTPHHSGPSTPRQLIPDILPNLRAFAEGRPIPSVVDRARGY